MDITNPIKPIYDKNSAILILGTIPSPKSREAGFYYSHPQNRFWRTIAAVLDEKLPTTIDEKKALLIRNKIALWDVLASCKISGADDNSIKDFVVNDFTVLFETTSIKAVFTTGKKAANCLKNIVNKDMDLKQIIFHQQARPTVKFHSKIWF